MPGCMSLQLVSMRWDNTICRFCVLHSAFGSVRVHACTLTHACTCAVSYTHLTLPTILLV
eukprot:9003588-Pyramimonas_sp.AAC.1